jgi:predicted secreted protein
VAVVGIHYEIKTVPKRVLKGSVSSYATAAIPLVLSLVLWPACGSSVQAARKTSSLMRMEVLNESANGRDLILRRGETFEITLAERPTTGFRWKMVSDGAPTCVLVGDSFEAPTDRTPGRTGQHSWTFRVERSGRATIELAAVRSWDAQAPAARVFRLTVTASD